MNVYEVLDRQFERIYKMYVEHGDITGDQYYELVKQLTEKIPCLISINSAAVKPVAVEENVVVVRR